jgi:hypothetical protein
LLQHGGIELNSDEDFFRESGEVFLEILDSLRNMALAANSLAEMAVELNFEIEANPQRFYDFLIDFESGVAAVREGYVQFCIAMGVDVAPDT